MPYLGKIFTSSAVITASIAMTQVTGVDTSPESVGTYIINALQNTGLVSNFRLSGIAIAILGVIGIISLYFDVLGIYSLIDEYDAKMGAVITAITGGVFGYFLITLPFNNSLGGPIAWLSFIGLILVIFMLVCEIEKGLHFDDI